jgi:hypothetical protein
MRSSFVSSSPTNGRLVHLLGAANQQYQKHPTPQQHDFSFQSSLHRDNVTWMVHPPSVRSASAAALSERTTAWSTWSESQTSSNSTSVITISPISVGVHRSLGIAYGISIGARRGDGLCLGSEQRLFMPRAEGGPSNSIVRITMRYRRTIVLSCSDPRIHGSSLSGAQCAAVGAV